MKYTDKLTIALLVLALCALPLSGCAESAPSPASSQPAELVQTTTAASEDSDDSWDPSNAAKITLNGTSAAAEGTGISVNGTTVTITQAGTYQVSGQLDDGQIVVNAGKDDLVRLVLNGASITCSHSAGIYAKQAGKTVLILAEGTQNAVTDGSEYLYPDGGDEPDAAIFAKDDLTITGQGQLAVTGNFHNGIGSKDNLIVTAGNLSIQAVNDGLRGRDSVSIVDGSFAIESGGDGIKSNNDEDTSKGWIRLDGGAYQITAGNDGIQAETSLTVTGGTYTIVAGGGSANAAVQGGDFGQNPGGMGGPNVRPEDDMRDDRGGTPPEFEGGPAGAQQPIPTAVSFSVADTVDGSNQSDSYKGIKSGTGMTISGGSFSIDAADDAVHTNGDLTVEDGNFTISTGDDGFHADGALAINGGSIRIDTSYEGLEGATVEINGGDIRLTASDDGINAAGGSDGNTGRTDTFRTGSGNYIRITSGFVLVDASGDGLDSNGALYLDGGTVLINGPTISGNSALDYDGICEITGGVLAAAGSAGMAQSPSDSSTQSSLMVNFTQVQEAGTLVNLSDAQGNTLLTFAPSKSFQNIVISTPDLTQGASYQLSTGGSCYGEADGGYYGASAYSGGTKLSDITLSAAVTRVAQDGTAMTGSMGGRMMGGGRGQGGFPNGVRPGRGAAPGDAAAPGR